MEYSKLTEALNESPDLGLLKTPTHKKSVLYYYEQDVYLIFASNTPESEPQNPIEGWSIIEVIPDPEKKGPSIIICEHPPIRGELF